MPAPKLQLHHTGFVVEDLEEAMASFGDTLSLHWAPPRHIAGLMRFPPGIQEIGVRVTMSLEDPHHIEQIEQVDPTPYLTLTGGRYVHHLGYYTTDLVASASLFEEGGFSVELAGVDPWGGVAGATFHQNPVAPGILIELLSQETADALNEWMLQAAADQGVSFSSLRNA